MNTQHDVKNEESTFVEIVVEGGDAKKAMTILLDRSASFSFEPLPDDFYRFTVKPEAVSAINFLEKNPGSQKFTVVGITPASGTRFALHVEAADAVEAAEKGLAHPDVAAWGPVLAGVFEGWIYAQDEQ